jgi:hypothetical protein
MYRNDLKHSFGEELEKKSSNVRYRLELLRLPVRLNELPKELIIF